MFSKYSHLSMKVSKINCIQDLLDRIIKFTKILFTGPMSTSVTQSIPSPVTSVSTLAPPHPSHPQTHHMGPQGLHNMMGSHGMGPPPHGMMPNGGMPPSSMMPPGHMGGGPGQMGGHMGHNMMPPHGMNGPMMGPNNQMMGHNGPMMPSHSGNMPPHMGQMPLQEQQQPTPPLQGNCIPPTSTSNNAGSNSTTSEDPPEKKKKNKVKWASTVAIMVLSFSFH